MYVNKVSPNVEFIYYRPQRSCGKVMFLHLCDSVHEGGGSLSRGVSVQGGLCRGVSLSKGVSVQGCLCPGVSVQGDLCPGGLWPGGSLSRGVSVQRGSLSSGVGVSVQQGRGLCPGGSMSGRPPGAIRLCAGGTHPIG